MKGKNENILFIRTGSFSHINDFVLEAFREEFPNKEIFVIDLKEELKQMGTMLKIESAFWSLLSLKGFSWKEIKNSLRLSPFYWELTNRLIKRKFGNGTTFLFSFQMQSNLNGNVGKCPHFIYTDHTHLVNLGYPEFNPKSLNSRTWIDKEKKLYNSCEGIFTMSNHVRESLITQYGVEDRKVKCVYAGANLSYNDIEFPIDRYRKKKVLFVGIDWVRKGGPELIECFKILLQKHPDAQLDIVGCNPEINIPNVKVWGRLPINEVKKFYEAASVFCMPSKREPFGIVYLEAMAYKLPIVALKIGALPDFVEEGKNGYLVEYKDIVGMASQLGLIFDQPELAKQMGENAFVKVKNQYNWSNSIKSIKEFIGKKVTL